MTDKTKTAQMLSAAIMLAAIKHQAQTDMGGNPYILHPLKVMYWLKTDDAELMCIAVLHDIIEDTGTTYDDLRFIGMSKRVLDGVAALTKQPGQTPAEYENQVMNNRDACLVKMQDLRHNSDLRRLKGVTDKDVARMQKYMRFYERLKAHVTNS